MKFWIKIIVICLIFLPTMAWTQYQIVRGTPFPPIKYDEETGQAWVLQMDEDSNWYWKKIEDSKKNIPRVRSGRNILKDKR